jgi:thiol-disulfide isomerase/thioredoxin
MHARMILAALAASLQLGAGTVHGCAARSPQVQSVPASGAPASSPLSSEAPAASAFEGTEGGTRTVDRLGPVSVGVQLPSFRGWTLNDESYGSRDLLSGEPAPKAAVVSYFATWCAPCRKGLPHIEEAVSSDPEVSGVLVSLDGPEEGQKIPPFLKELGIGTPTLWDKFRTIAQRHGVVGGEAIAIPKTFVLDGNGVVRTIFAEEGEDFPVQLSAAIAEAKKPLVGGSAP